MRGGKTFLFYLSDILIKPLIKEDEGPGESSNRKYEKGNLFPTFSRAIFCVFDTFFLFPDKTNPLFYTIPLDGFSGS